MVLLLSGRYAVLVVLSIEVRGSDVKDFSRDSSCVKDFSRDLSFSFQFHRFVVVGHGVNPVCSS